MAKTALSVHKQGDTYVVDGLGSPSGALKFGRGMRTGTVTMGGRALPIAATGRLRTRVTAGEDAILCHRRGDAYRTMTMAGILSPHMH
ncbi:hypothetical protein [Streptomyces sp. NBC_00316]|uniref:hypothetical protein n=1 Tax=Streptomyces sp. NBC_00316 TaxID=2975710 RepID=UPI002E2A280E|nr:hypothetical protein [Streptomyces sp. NBC_00316]